MHLTTKQTAYAVNAPEACNIDVQSLSPSAWRICDTRFSQHDDARALIGFVEEKDGVFEVMQMGRGFEWFTYATLEDAIAHFVRVSPPATGTEHVLSWLPSHA
ncbi:hypothetical protein GCM10027052_19440 [Parafrigoribacterium mesophilum]|uniref:hypothetical protein n=1 Tax=Parafrigoribacterium mesophilum TaxID=433646 RepID=UPI0031FD84B1